MVKTMFPKFRKIHIISETLSLPPCPAHQSSYSTTKVPEMEFSDHVDIKNAQEHYQTPSELGVRALQSY